MFLARKKARWTWTGISQKLLDRARCLMESGAQIPLPDEEDDDKDNIEEETKPSEEGPDRTEREFSEAEQQLQELMAKYTTLF